MQQALSGRVVDSNGEPLVGASVKQLGTSRGTVTDGDGKFLLNVAPGTKLIVSYVGSKDRIVRASQSMNIVLDDDVSSIDEVVVVGYGTQKKANLSGAVATADTKKLANRPANNIGSALEGAVANLNIDPVSGDPNDLPSFNIRGFTSINGGSPLVVIDGVISDAVQLNHLNPADIANISVLKDAASAAIYGSRAAYGVILVTTKTGNSEKVTVNYNGNFDWRGLTVKPDYVDDPSVYYHDRNQADTGNPNSGSWPTEMFEAIDKWKADPANNPDHYYMAAWDEYFGFKFFNPADTYIKNNAFSTTHNINISGKTDKVNYYLSGAYQYQDGMIKVGTNTYNQYNTRAKLDIQITPWWKIGSNTSLISTLYNASTSYMQKHDDTNRSPWGYGTVMETLMSIIPFGWSMSTPGSDFVYDWATDAGRLKYGGMSKKHDTTVGQQFTTRIDILKNVLFLNGQYNFSLQKVSTDMTHLPFMGSGGFDSGTWENDAPSWSSFTNSRVRHITFETYATFHKLFAEKHDVTAILGFNQEAYRYNTQYAQRQQLISTSVPSANLAYGEKNISESTTTWTLRGLYGRLGYIYDDKYIAEFDFRRDMTSRFPHSSRTVFNPSGSVAWVVSKENFFQPLNKVFDQLKLRASYGQLGNQDVSAYAYIPTMRAYTYGSLIGGTFPMTVGAPGLVSGNLTWEKVRTLDFGLDLVMLNNRLSLTADIYRRDTKDMLTTQGRDLPSVLGTSVPQENAADLKTIGWDITVGWRDHFNLAGKPFHYSIDANMADSWAEITKVANETGSLSSYYTGQRLGEIWGYQTEGIFATDEEAKNWADMSEVLYQPGKYPQRAGTIKLADLNDDHKITRGAYTLKDHGDLKVIGNSSIRYRFGLTLGAQWNGIDFSAFFQGCLKHNYYPGWWDRDFWGFYSISWFYEPKNNLNRWTEENKNTNAWFPRLEQGNAHSLTKELSSQTKYLQDASYIRLKNLTVGYTLPASWLKNLPITRVRVYYTGENLFNINGLYSGYKADPENLGWQYYPIQRHHSLGVNITF